MRTADPSVEICDCEPFVYMPAWWSSFLFRVIPPRKLAVYTYLAMLGVKEGISTPTVRQIQDDMGLASDTTVYDALRGLEDADLIRRVRLRNDAGVAQNGYRRPSCQSTLIALLEQRRIDHRLRPVAASGAQAQSEAVTELAIVGLKTLLGDDFPAYASAAPSEGDGVLLDLLRASLAKRRRVANEHCVCDRGETRPKPDPSS